MPSIRKLPVTYNPKKPKTGRGEFLIPHLSGIAESGFIGIKSGRRAECGALSYIGMDVTPEMLLERYCERQPPSQAQHVCREFAGFQDWQRFDCELHAGFTAGVTP